MVMERTVNELRGISCLDLEEIAPAKKQIISSKSFGEMVTTIDELAQAVSSYTSRAAEKLRQQNSVCSGVHVFIHTNPFRGQDKQYSNGVTVTLPDPSSDTRLLVSAALAGLQRIYRPGFFYTKAGIMLMEIGGKRLKQHCLFDDEAGEDRSDGLMDVLDRLNQSFSHGAVYLASNGVQNR